ncbi:MAG: orotate phosphoribosyltransferase [Nitrospira sp.]
MRRSPPNGIRTKDSNSHQGKSALFYVDCRALMAHPIARNLVAQLAFWKIKDLPFDCIGGLEIGAIAIATGISDHGLRIEGKDWPTFVVRKQEKGHGLGKKIEGIAEQGARALIVDDVLTSGGSILRAVEAARQAGLVVDRALVIVDRQEQDGQRNLEKSGVQLLSLLTIRDFQSVQTLAPALSR